MAAQGVAFAVLAGLGGSPGWRAARVLVAAAVTALAVWFTRRAEAELSIDPDQLAHPGHAAWASFLSFTAGAVLPLLAITLVPGPARIAVTIIAVLAALVATGAASAALGRAPRRPAVVRNVIGGGIAMGVTYGIGTLIAAAGI